jgi:flagellar FliL protein
MGLDMAVAEAEGDDAAPEAGAAPRKGLPRRTLIIIIAAVVLLLAGGASAWFFLFAAKPAEQTHAVVEVPESFIFNLPSMTVNLNNDGQTGGDQFMKITIALEVADEKVMQEIQPRMAKVVDAFQVYLRELRKSDLEGSAGIYRLKEELRRRVNVAIFPAQVEAILFKEILIQ